MKVFIFKLAEALLWLGIAAWLGQMHLEHNALPWPTTETRAVACLLGLAGLGAVWALTRRLRVRTVSERSPRARFGWRLGWALLLGYVAWLARPGRHARWTGAKARVAAGCVYEKRTVQRDGWDIDARRYVFELYAANCTLPLWLDRIDRFEYEYDVGSVENDLEQTPSGAHWTITQHPPRDLPLKILHRLDVD